MTRLVGDVSFSRPVAVPARDGHVTLRSAQQALDWIDRQQRRRLGPRLRDVAWRLRDAQEVRSQNDVDDASDRLVHVLANLGVLRR
ncbi:MAG TPA: hypothetical protein VJ890_15865 [Vineibacter sp.]|nr:hypothetical protein [Vineibacter sp.]